MRTRNRIVAVGTVVALGAALLTACGGGGSEQVSNDGTGNVVLWYLPDDADFIQAIKPAFERDNPGTTLDAVSVPEDNYVTKIDTAILAQQSPDVVFEYDTKWIKAGRVLPVDQIMADAGVDMSVFNPVAMKECVFDGKTYCIGSVGGATMLIYNKAMFDAAGIAYPSSSQPMTIDEFADIARKLVKPDPDVNKQVFGAAVSGPVNGMTSWATFFGEDGKSAGGNTDSDRTIHLFDVLSQLARDNVSVPPSVGELSEAPDMLATGNAAMAITDMEAAARAMDGAGLAWGAAPPPVIESGDTPFMFVGTDKYAALKGGKNNLGAQKFQVWLAKNGGDYRINIGKPPLDSTLLTQWAGDSAGKQEVIQVLALARTPNPFVPQVWSVLEDVIDLYRLLASGEETDSAAALRDLAPRLQEKLDLAWESWDETT